MLKPPLIADVSEFRLFPQQQQVTRAIFKLFELDKKKSPKSSRSREPYLYLICIREKAAYQAYQPYHTIPGIPTTEYRTRQYHHDLMYAVGQTISSDKPISDKSISDKPNMCYTTIYYMCDTWHKITSGSMASFTQHTIFRLCILAPFVMIHKHTVANGIPKTHTYHYMQDCSSLQNVLHFY